MAAAAMPAVHRLARGSSASPTTYKMPPRAPLHLAPLNRALLPLYAAAPKEPAGAPRLAADPLRRRLFFPFERLGEILFTSSSFWCIPLVV
jgi:hypothetical protein